MSFLVMVANAFLRFMKAMYRSYFSFAFFLDLPVVDMVSQANLFCKPY